MPFIHIWESLTWVICPKTFILIESKQQWNCSKSCGCILQIYPELNISAMCHSYHKIKKIYYTFSKCFFRTKSCGRIKIMSPPTPTPTQNIFRRGFVLIKLGGIVSSSVIFISCLIYQSLEWADIHWNSSRIELLRFECANTPI